MKAELKELFYGYTIPLNAAQWQDDDDELNDYNDLDYEEDDEDE